MWQFLLAVLEKVDNANWVLPTSVQTKGKCVCTVKKICACIWDKCDQGEEANCVLITASAMSWDKTIISDINTNTERSLVILSYIVTTKYGYTIPIFCGHKFTN